MSVLYATPKDRVSHVAAHIEKQYTNFTWKKVALSYGPQCEKFCLRGFANSKGADQDAYTRSMISAFIIRLFESIISSLTSSKISNF